MHPLLPCAVLGEFAHWASGVVATVCTTSTSRIAGPGTTCRPTTSPARPVAAAHSMTGSVEVVVASASETSRASAVAPSELAKSVS